MTDHELAAKRARDIMPEAAEFLREIIAIPSMSGEEENVARRIAREMMQRGFDEVNIDAFGSVIGRMGDGVGGDTVRTEWGFEPGGGHDALGSGGGRDEAGMPEPCFAHCRGDRSRRLSSGRLGGKLP